MQPKEKPHFARPHAGRDVKALEGAVEGDDAPLAPLPLPIIERHLKAARIGDGLKAQKRIAQGKRSGTLGHARPAHTRLEKAEA